VVIAGMYLVTAWMSDTSLSARWSYTGSFVVLLATTGFVWGWSFTNYGVYVAVMMAMLIPWRQSRIAICVWGLILLAIAVGTRDWTPAYIALIGVGIGLATGLGMESGRVRSKLNRAEQRNSVLAVAAERERIGRDLHDILGHSLTAISIKSALAARLVDQDPTAAKLQLGEIEEVARQALADVRATASGFREVRVATEIASARSVLLAAGIEAHVPTAVGPLSNELSELFGFVVREGVTNVVRHSEATTCTITVDAHQVSVTDDGIGFERLGHGSGLGNLADRVAARGGRFVVDSVPGRGTTLRAVMETAAGPVPAGPVSAESRPVLADSR
jgi:two-component system sensor histidine kinase DesK